MFTFDITIVAIMFLLGAIIKDNARTPPVQARANNGMKGTGLKPSYRTSLWVCGALYLMYALIWHAP